MAIIASLEFTGVFFALAVFICAVLTCYSWGYYRESGGGERCRRFSLLLFCLPVAGYFLFTSTHWLAFFCWWEIVTFVTAAMIYLSSPGRARQYFWWQTGGAALLLAGLALYSLDQPFLVIRPLETGFDLLFLAGLGAKSALLGFHFWLAPVHAGVDSPCSALLSGTAVKFGLLPLLFLFSGGHPLLIPAGLGLYLLGAAGALVQENIKRALAYSTLSNLGLIYFLLGNGGPYVVVAQLQILTHAAGKTVLFMTAGLIGQAAGSYRFEEWRAFDFFTGKRLPYILLWTAGLLLLSGLPPLVFLSAKPHLEPLVTATRISSFLFWLGSMLTLGYLFKLFAPLFSGKKKTAARPPAVDGLAELAKVIATTAVMLLPVIPLTASHILPGELAGLVKEGRRLTYSAGLRFWEAPAALLLAAVITKGDLMRRRRFSGRKAFFSRVQPRCWEQLVLWRNSLVASLRKVCPFKATLWFMFLAAFLFSVWFVIGG